MGNSLNTGIEFFKEQCKKHNLKITPQRILIYNIISDSKEHPDADSVYKIVKTTFPNISLDTAHRTLLTFAEIRLIDVVEGFGSPKRFDPNVTNHHHIYCQKCCKITDFINKEFDSLEVPGEFTKGFKINKKRVVISGLCKRCQKKN